MAKPFARKFYLAESLRRKYHEDRTRKRTPGGLGKESPPYSTDPGGMRDMRASSRQEPAVTTSDERNS